MTQWRRVTVGEVAEVAIGPFGSSLKADLYVRDGMPVVSGMHLGRSISPSLDGADCVDQATVQRLERSVLRPGDLVFPHRGSIGRVGLVDRPMMMSTSMMRARFGPSVLPQFAYWYFVAEGNRQLLTMASSVGTPGIGQPLASLKSVPFLLPDLDVQQGIAEVLGALDDKIAANHRVIDMADTLRATLWQRLCRHSEPRPLSSLARFVNGRAFTKDATGTGRVVVRIAELNSGLSGSTVRNDIDVADDHLARPGDFLMAWSGSLTAARWFRDEAIVNQHIFKVIPTQGRSLWSVACAVDSKMADFKHEAAGKATTMGHIQRRHLDEPVLWPVWNDESEAQGQALWERALAAERENETLAKTRDELLSPLMSGKITVRDAEKRVEGVV